MYISEIRILGTVESPKFFVSCYIIMPEGSECLLFLYFFLQVKRILIFRYSEDGISKGGAWYSYIQGVRWNRVLLISVFHLSSSTLISLLHQNLLLCLTQPLVQKDFLLYLNDLYICQNFSSLNADS